MIALLYVTIFALACAASFVAISRRVDARLGGGVATALWGLLAPASFNIIVYSGGTSFTTTSQMLAFFTAAMTLVLLTFTFAAATSKLPDRDNTRFGANQ